MSSLEIIKMGHPVLRKIAREMTSEEILSTETKLLVQEMQKAMHTAAGVGLAAPQINRSIQLAIIEYDLKEELPEDADPPLYVFINPKISILDKPQYGFWEGCLSVPGLTGYVERPNKVRVDYIDLEGQAQNLTAEGFAAVIIQHELDHLQGILYVDRLADPTKFAYQEEFQQFWSHEEELE